MFAPRCRVSAPMSHGCLSDAPPPRNMHSTAPGVPAPMPYGIDAGSANMQSCWAPQHLGAPRANPTSSAFGRQSLHSHLADGLHTTWHHAQEPGRTVQSGIQPCDAVGGFAGATPDSGSSPEALHMNLQTQRPTYVCSHPTQYLSGFNAPFQASMAPASMAGANGASFVAQHL